MLSALAPVLSGTPDFKVTVVNDLGAIPKGRMVLVLGTAPHPALQAIKLIPKNRTIKSLRNTPYMYGESMFLFSYSAGIHAVDYALYVELLCDTKDAIRYALTGKFAPVMGKYEWVDDFNALIAAIKEQYAKTGKPVEVCFDTETRGRDPLHPEGRFVTLQFTHKPGTGCAVFIKSKEHWKEWCLKGGREQMLWLLTTDMISLRLANGKFDMIWVWFHLAIECTNYKFDTTLAGNLLDENRSNSLDVHAKIYTPLGGYSDEFDRTIDKGRMDLLPQDDKLLNYACGDTDAGLQASTAIKADLLKDKALTNFYVNILHPASRAFEVIERGGVFIDMEAYKELESQVDAKLLETAQKAKAMMGGRIVAKHQDPTAHGGINLTKKAMLMDFMFSPMGLNLKPQMLTAKTKEPSTAYEHLMMFAKHPEAGPFVQLIEEYTSAAKTKSTYITGFKEHIRSDGRFHPSYFLFKGREFADDDEHGTVTGRLSAVDPAFQTVPKHTFWGKLLRRVFAAPPGYLVLERDYSQGELRVVACIANEYVMIEAYRQGKDLHVVTGASIVGMTYEDVLALKKTDPDRYDAIRQPAKPANFGLLYGQSAEGFQMYAKNNYGVDMSLDRAQEIRTAFFALYKALPVYHKQYKDFAHKFMYVTSPLGRVRHLPLINSPDRFIKSQWERKAINSPVQSTLSDLMIWALGLENQQGGFKVAPCFGVVHDAAYDYVPEDKHDQIVEQKRELMENLPLHKLGWNPPLKFIADCKTGKNMADLKEVKRKAA